MGRFLLLSIVVASVTLPALAARDNSARRGLRKLFARIVPFVLLYWTAVMFLTPD
jgi:hypothetical protein